MASTQDRDYITTHVLDVMTGEPGRAIQATLTLRNPEETTGQKSFQGFTNMDGRINSWTTPDGQADGLQRIFEGPYQKAGSENKRTVLSWTLSFHVQDYFASVEQRTLWDTIDINFKTVVGGEERRTHWHVPLLLSPYSYTVYRGS